MTLVWSGLLIRIEGGRSLLIGSTNPLQTTARIALVGVLRSLGVWLLHEGGEALRQERIVFFVEAAAVRVRCAMLLSSSQLY